MKKPQIFEFFRRLAELNPEPETELEYKDPYTLLVAVALSAQANLATRKLFKVADTPEKMVELGEEALKEHIKTIGLFNTKAKNVIALSEKLLGEHGNMLALRYWATTSNAGGELRGKRASVLPVSSTGLLGRDTARKSRHGGSLAPDPGFPGSSLPHTCAPCEATWGEWSTAPVRPRPLPTRHTASLSG